MGRKKIHPPEKERDEERSVYEMRTPLWTKYYNEVRKRVRFPRYYKKAVNW